MRITAIAVAGLVASTLVTAIPAQAEVTARPAVSRFYPLQPPPAPSQGDPRAEVEELQRQVNELHDSWDSLTPEQRQQRLAQLQQLATTVSNDVHNLPPGQQLEVEARLLQTIGVLYDLVGKAQSPSQPCQFPFCLPGL
jgi:HAMP domain-containing protein